MKSTNMCDYKFRPLWFTQWAMSSALGETKLSENDLKSSINLSRISKTVLIRYMIVQFYERDEYRDGPFA